MPKNLAHHLNCYMKEYKLVNDRNFIMETAVIYTRFDIPQDHSDNIEGGRPKCIAI